MNKNIPILIIGFGSIGQRHYRNLLKMGYRNITVYDSDKSKVSNFKFQVPSLQVESLKRFNIVFVCSPNNLHIKQALLAASAGCHVFIEKPLSHNLEGIKKLTEICKKKKLVNMVACNLRFHPCLRFIKNYLEKGRLGKIYSINLEGAYFLPFWRPGSDYRKNYAASPKTGGGIILDGIHEFDLLFWLNSYAKIRQSKFIFQKVSDLAIRTEDICLAIFEFENGLLASVKCDYLQKAYSRNCKIVGERGNLEWDYLENAVWLKNERGEKKIFSVKNYNPNNFYLEEVRYFMQCVKTGTQTFNGVNLASKVLTVCLNSKLQ